VKAQGQGSAIWRADTGRNACATAWHRHSCLCSGIFETSEKFLDLATRKGGKSLNAWVAERLSRELARPGRRRC
jgi:hypothetical protein